MHHKNPNRDGLYIQPTLTKAAAATLVKDTTFAPTIVGEVYAQPLFVDGGAGGQDLVIVATEANNVYALDATTGAQVWTMNAGAPVPVSDMPCGNLSEYGITGTPVIDFASRTLFFDAMTSPDGGTTKHHQLFALSVDTGAPQTGWPVDVGATAKSGTTTFNATSQGQRGGLAIVDGTLYAAYGGLYGDCSVYHGWVVAVPIATPTTVSAWATSLNGGGIWSPGGVSYDGANVYVATGNTFNAVSSGGTYVWGGGEAILRFATGSTIGAPSSYFSPTNWHDLDNADQDLGSTPVFISLVGAPGSTPNQVALSFGKDGNAYLVDPANLGGVGKAFGAAGPSYSSGMVATDQIITAPAVYTTATATYVAYQADGALCTGGSGDLATVKITPGTPPTVTGSWCANVNGGGAPIVTTTDGHSEAIVWGIGAGGGNLLLGFDGDTGATVFGGGGVSIPNMRRYNSPIAAKGRIFVAADNAVVAFKVGP
jgi:hypothetical protein